MWVRILPLQKQEKKKRNVGKKSNKKEKRIPAKEAMDSSAVHDVTSDGVDGIENGRRVSIGMDERREWIDRVFAIYGRWSPKQVNDSEKMETKSRKDGECTAKMGEKWREREICVANLKGEKK